ncbi:unnamed protein product [Allacma fusca]|uniref:Small ribosomal subunit protein mS29 n=1 Tax=Allacma fusca TaxID=39272 RepID=A0A8J2Q4U6_9HEXA|nr:unnamed protein product [Allacma fusca]
MLRGVPTAFLRKVLKSERCYSTASVFRTLETNPVQLNESHEGRFYTVQTDEYKTLFGVSDKGLGLPSDFKIQCTTFRESCIMVRRPFLDIKRCIESYDLSLPVLRYVLYGAAGVGKTMTLANLVHYGHAGGFLLVHIPWVPVWTRFAKETVPSAERPGFVDHTSNSVFWLTFFRHENAKLLAEANLKTSKTYEWSKRESTPEGSSITDIIEHGIARPTHAAECICALISEIKLASSEKRIKTMVAIDGINGLFVDSGKRIKRDDKTIVPYQNITVFTGFKQLLASDWTGGVVITTVDKLAVASDLRELDTPRYLLGKDGWEHMDPFIPINVEKYSHQELQTTIDYYLDRKWLQHPLAGTKEARQELETVSVRNPYTLMQLCKSR